MHLIEIKTILQHNAQGSRIEAFGECPPFANGLSLLLNIPKIENIF